jgi:Leucine-rich repeat (LRR) protein
MWPFLPKKCDCSETPTNLSIPCDPTLQSSDEFVYDGPDLPCINVHHNDTLTTALQELDYYLCGRLFTQQVMFNIETNITAFPDFVTLINNVVSCDTILSCLTSSTTTSTTSSSTSTTTTTTTCHHPNLVINGEFDTSLVSWNQTISNSWIWSANHGGSAFYNGLDENSLLYQSILTPGITYDVSFHLWCDSPCAVPVKVFVGTTEYDITGITGDVDINLIITCTGNTLFGIQAYDACGEPNNSIYINNVVVSEHCPQFTTTTTTILQQKNFDITGNWNLTTPPVVDALSFKTFLESGYDGDDTQNGFSDVVITDFSLIEGRLTCNLFALENSSNFNLAYLEITDVSLFGDIIGLSNISLYTNNINNVNDTTWPNSMTQLDLSNNQIVNFNPTFQLPNSLSSLYLNGNQIVTFNPSVPLPSSLSNLLLSNNLIVNFNPSIPLPSLTQIVLSYNNISTFNPSISLPLSLQGLALTGNAISIFNPTIALPNSLNYLGLEQNLMTTAGYTASEPWANAMTNIPGRGNIVFTSNTNSVTGTNLATILHSKGWSTTG